MLMNSNVFRAMHGHAARGAMLAWLCTLAPQCCIAADITHVTLVQMHPAIGVGEEIFMYAVPKALGYFAQEKLDVAIEGVSGGGPAAQALQSGQAEFATTMPESILQLRERGGDPIAIYTLKQNTGSIMLLAADSPIHAFGELKGKTIGAASFGAGGGLAVKDHLAQIGITPDQYSAVSTGVNAASFTALQSHQLDALVVWDGMRGAAENTGMALRTLEIPDQDKIAAMTFATTQRFIRDHKDQVSGMCRAVAKGLHFALANPNAAIRLFWQEFPTAKPSGVDQAVALRNQRHIMDRWFESSEQGVAPGHETGAMRPDSWELMREVYVKTGALKGTIPATQGYTSDFISSCNAYDHAAIEAQAAAMPQ